MKQVELIMGMPIEIEVVSTTSPDVLQKVFAYLRAVDEQFSTYKAESEISRMHRGEIALAAVSTEMREVLALSQRTKEETAGYFDIQKPNGFLDPSGIVKGWAIKNAAALIEEAGHTDYFVNAGGDIASQGVNEQSEPWSVGIRNPFAPTEVVKVIYPKGKGVATSGSYIRGHHIYNPHTPSQKVSGVVSLTVIGPDVLEADRFATGAFAMGAGGITFIEQLPGFEGYAIDENGIATMTSGFERYTTVYE